MRTKDLNPTPARHSHWLVCLVSGFFVATRLDGIGFGIEAFRVENEGEYEIWAYGGRTTYTVHLIFFRWCAGYEITFH